MKKFQLLKELCLDCEHFLMPGDALSPRVVLWWNDETKRSISTMLEMLFNDLLFLFLLVPMPFVQRFLTYFTCYHFKEAWNGKADLLNAILC